MIRIRDLTFAFPERPVLWGLSLTIEESLTTVVVGRSGIGKSVLLKCITGLLAPQSGSITIDGEEVVGAEKKDLLRIRRKTGMLFQEGALFDSLTVFENVAFPLSYHKLYPADEIARKVQDYLELVGMADYAQAMPRELSGGMKRKVAVARAMILEPRYLLYDEPTAGLDPSSAAVVEAMIMRLQAERSITSLVVTHDIDLTRYVADRIALLEDGHIVALMPRDEAFHPGSPVYEHFIESRERIRQEKVSEVQ
ncbi:MAG TPA: ATP-binding cassette domain-containing protein [Spirochaetia bacterium]|nr:ATP-binding cassette domain-containing protein [Spirochaetia bacterium]